MEVLWLLDRCQAERGGPSLALTGRQCVRSTRCVGAMIERLDSAVELTGPAHENRRGLVGRGGSADAATAARKAEQERPKRITGGTARIDEQFARFDEPFLNSVEQTALDFYISQLRDQFDDTREGMIKHLARGGTWIPAPVSASLET